jgi:transposase
LIEAQGAVPNIPAKSNRKWRPCFSKTLYRERNQVERFFSKLKHFRRVATRYDKLADNFLAMVKLASMRGGCALMSLRPSNARARTFVRAGVNA